MREVVPVVRDRVYPPPAPPRSEYYDGVVTCPEDNDVICAGEPDEAVLQEHIDQACVELVRVEIRLDAVRSKVKAQAAKYKAAVKQYDDCIAEHRILESSYSALVAQRDEARRWVAPACVLH